MTKITANLPEETVAELRQIAEKEGLTLTAALRQAISTQKFVTDEIRSGGKLVIERSGRPSREVIFR
jgi:predicted transcriptional regulator